MKPKGMATQKKLRLWKTVVKEKIGHTCLIFCSGNKHLQLNFKNLHPWQQTRFVYSVESILTMQTSEESFTMVV